MSKNAFGDRAAPGPAVRGSLQRSPEPLTGFKGMGGKWMREKGEGKEGVKGKREG